MLVSKHAKLMNATLELALVLYNDKNALRSAVIRMGDARVKVHDRLTQLLEDNEVNENELYPTVCAAVSLRAEEEKIYTEVACLVHVLWNYQLCFGKPDDLQLNKVGLKLQRMVMDGQKSPKLPFEVVTLIYAELDKTAKKLK